MGTTILFSAVDEAKARFPQYVTELETFLGQYKVRTGTPDALSTLAKRVGAELDLREDLASMLAVLTYQEPALSKLELLGLVVAATNGSEAAEELAAKPALDEAGRQLFQFIVDARRSRNLAGATAPETADLPEALSADALGTMEIEPPAVPLSSSAPAPAREPSSVLARALALAGDDEVLASGSRPPAEKRPDAFPEERSGKPNDVPVPLAGSSALQKSSTAGRAWLAGVCGVVLGLLLGLFGRDWFKARNVPSPPVPVSASAPTNLPESAGVRLRHPSGTRVALPAVGDEPRPRTAYREESTVRAGDVARGHADRVYETSTSVPSTKTALAGAPPRGAAVVSPAGSDGHVAGNRHVVAPGKAATLSVARLSAPAPDSTVSAAIIGRPRTGRVMLGSAGIMAANLISSPAPPYPTEATAAQVQGEVVIEAIVGRNGEVIDTRVVSGPPMLRQAALSAVQRWRYRPYEVDGKAAEIATTARVDFRLDGN